MPRTIRLDLAYEGTAYRGFAVQPGLPTIQEVVERALGEVLGHAVRVTPAGRTDSGVHARGQVLSFRTEARLPAAAIGRALAVRLPEDILAGPSAEAEPAFDARRSARRRHYRYTIWRGARPELWSRRYSLHLTDPLDVKAMRAASAALIGRQDFASFVGHAVQEPAPLSAVRQVERAEWSCEGDFLHFDCSADAFARHMIRSIVGTLLWVGRGRLTPHDVRRALAARDRRAAGPTAPPHGLTLMQVDYDERETER